MQEHNEEHIEPAALPIPKPVNGEPRIKDIDLAKRLGFAQPRSIRELISRHRAALMELGTLPTYREHDGGRGRPQEGVSLNKKQAIFITAKSETEAATEITLEVIERFDAYERGEQPKVVGQLPRGLSIAHRELDTIARRWGYDDNQRKLAVNRAMTKLVGVNLLEAFGEMHLIAPQQETHLSATQVGAKLGELRGQVFSAVATNKLLERFGFQMKDGNSDSRWKHTDKGKSYAVWIDTGKSHGNGTSVRQLRWSEGVVAALAAEMGAADANGAAA